MNYNQLHGSNVSVGAKVLAFIFITVLMFIVITALNTVLQVILAVSAKNRGLVGSHQITISNDGLSESTEFNASTHRWTAFHKFRSSTNYIFLYVTENNVIYVPKRCFSSPQEEDQFREQILGKTRH